MTIHIARAETLCRHMGYSFQLAAIVPIYIHTILQTGYNSRGSLAGTTNSSMKDRSDDPSHHVRTLLSRSYISPLLVHSNIRISKQELNYLSQHLNCYKTKHYWIIQRTHNLYKEYIPIFICKLQWNRLNIVLRNMGNVMHCSVYLFI